MTNIFPILKDIAENYLISIEPRLVRLFSDLNPNLWIMCGKSPINFVRLSIQKNIVKEMYLTDISELIKSYNQIKLKQNTKKKLNVAYFSPEFGFHESFRNYAGGLGILAGDYLKTYNDTDFNIIGVGLLYDYGYFKQIISKNNVQNTIYEKMDFNLLQFNTQSDFQNDRFKFQIHIYDTEIFVEAYKIKVHNSIIILLSTNVELNDKYKNITEKLYTGNRELRLLQEMVLGIGGIIALDISDIKVDILHINEGHAAFAILQRAIEYSKIYKISVNESIEILRKTTVFTTHTPVIHGNEEFKVKLIKKNFASILDRNSINVNEFLDYGKHSNLTPDMFSMTALALNLSGTTNGVSKLHTETANEMWNDLIEKNVKISKIVNVTNGIHIHSWANYHLKKLLTNYHIDLDKPELIKSPFSNEEIIQCKRIMKNEMIENLKQILLKRNIKFYKNLKNIELDKPNIIIGFARRFAKYKRADLVFSNINKLKEIIKNSDIPVHFIFSGKAHPKDVDGKEILSNILNYIQENDLSQNIHFVPDYDMEIGRNLVSGCDIWLNTPVKPLEACGTSGMKAALNFGINLSITDGWWAEAYNGNNGFGVDDNESSLIVCDNILEIIENKIIQMYVNIEHQNLLVNMMRESFETSIINFNSYRMLKDYTSIYDECLKI